MRYTLHKAKKRWLIVGTSLLLTTGIGLFSAGPVRADTVVPPQAETPAAGLAEIEQPVPPISNSGQNTPTAVVTAAEPAATETAAEAGAKPETAPAASTQAETKSAASGTLAVSTKSAATNTTATSANTPSKTASQPITAAKAGGQPAAPTTEPPAQAAPAVPSLATIKTLSERGGTITDWIPDVNFRNQVLAALHSANLLPANQGAAAVTPAMIDALTALQLGQMINATAPDGIPATDVKTVDPSQSVKDLTGIGIFSSLKQLTLTDNSFQTIPDEISQLTNLTDLTITRNTALTHIGDLSGLQNVTHLAITNNSQLTELPPSINTLTNVRGTLDLHGNSFTTLPDLSALQQVTTLDLNNNRLTSITGGQLDQLANLTALNLGSYDGANYQEFVTGLGHDLNSSGPLTNSDFWDAVPAGDNNVHLNYDPTVKAPNMTLKDARGNTYYAYQNVFTQADKEHYNHLTELPATLSQLTNLQKLNLVGNDLTDLPTSFSALTKLTDLRLGNNRFTAIPTAVQQLIGSNPSLTVSFSNYLANYPSFGTYRNQNGILQSQIWSGALGGFLIPGWNPKQHQVLSQVVKFPQHYVVTYNSNNTTLMPGSNHPYVTNTPINDSQLIQINGLYYTGPETLTADPKATSGAVVQQFVHYPNNMANGTDRNGRYTAPSLNTWNFGAGYYGGMYGAANDVLTVGAANQTLTSAGQPLPLYPYQDPYTLTRDSMPTSWRGWAANGNFYYMLLLPRDWSPDKDNVGKTYALNFSIGGKYSQNAPDGGASNGTGSMNGFVQPDETGYSMVATTDVTFVMDGAISVKGQNSTVAQGHPWDPAQGFVNAVKNDTNKTEITTWADANGQVTPGVGVDIYAVVPDQNGVPHAVGTFKDAADFNQNATAYWYTDGTHSTYLLDRAGNKIPRYYVSRYHYIEKDALDTLITVTDHSTLTLQDSQIPAKGVWTLHDAKFSATDPDGTTPLNDTTATTTDQVALRIVDDSDPTAVFTDTAAFNAGKQSGHTYTVTARTYDQRAATGQSTQLFFLKEASAKITVAPAEREKINYGLHGTDGKVFDGQPGAIDPGKYQVTTSTGGTYQPVGGDLVFVEPAPTTPGTYHVVLSGTGEAHVQATNPAAEWTNDGSQGTYVITPAETKPDTPKPPVTPGGGETPTTPITPPVTPEQPGQQPGEPEKPAVPEEPADKPTEPGSPEQPQEPGTTGDSHITPSGKQTSGGGLQVLQHTVAHTTPAAVKKTITRLASRLPQTDEQTSVGLTLLGIVTSLLAGWGLLKRREEEK